MNDDNTSTTLPMLWIALWVIFVLVPAFVAMLVAPDRQRTFFWITLFFLGPLGPGFALIAQPRLYQQKPPPPPDSRWWRTQWPAFPPRSEWPDLPPTRALRDWQ